MATNPALHVRLRYRLAGGHVDCRVYIGADVDHLALAGELTLRVEEWIAFRRGQMAAEFVCDDPPEVRETYDTLLRGVVVTTRDLDTGEGESMVLEPDNYVLVLGERMEQTHEQISPTTGARVLTLKPRTA